MKIFYSVVVFIVMTTTKSYSQSFSLSELVSLCGMNIDDFDTYVTEKGYKFKETTVESGYERHSYWFNKVERNKQVSINKYIISFTQKDVVNFTTYNPNYYLDIKKSLKLFGYKFLEKDNNKELSGTSLIYEKGKVKAILSSSLVDASFGGKATIYEIGIEKTY